jgi:O-antigen ligase
VAALSIVQVVACPVSPPPWPVLGRFSRKCGRAHGFFSIYMTLAGVLMMVLAAVLPSLVVSPRLRAVGVAGWIVGVIAFGLTNVRGAWIGLLAGVFVGAVAARRRLALRLAAAVLVLAAIAAVPNVLERVRSPGPRWVLDDTARDRLAMLAGGLRMIADRPVTGVGPGQVKRVYPDYAPPDALRRATSHLHDTPLQIAVERGIVGLALWLALFAAFYARAVAIYRRVDDDEDRAMVAGVLAAITSFLIAGLFEYNFGDTEVLLVACALMALPFAIDRPAPRS